MSEIVSTMGAAKMLDCSPDHVRHLERAGKLKATRTDYGQRLFQRKEVERFATLRAGQKKKRKP